MCGVETCPVHTRTDVKDPVEANIPARAVTYTGEYAVATLDNPEFGSAGAILAAIFGGPASKEQEYFQHLVVKVGDGTLGDLLETPGALTEATVFKQNYLLPSDRQLDEVSNAEDDGVNAAFNAKLTELMHGAHDLVVESVKQGIIPAE